LTVSMVATTAVVAVTGIIHDRGWRRAAAPGSRAVVTVTVTSTRHSYNPQSTRRRELPSPTHCQPRELIRSLGQSIFRGISTIDRILILLLQFFKIS
jgi:hypothetical protein